MRIFLTLFFVSFGALSSVEHQNIYDEHQTKMMELKYNIEVLQLKKNIAELEKGIRETKGTLFNKKSVFQSTPQPVITESANSIVSDEIDAKLLYMLDDGNVRLYSIMISGEEVNLKLGQVYQGWRLALDDDKLYFIKGKASYNVK